MSITIYMPSEIEKQLREEYPDLDRRVLDAYVVEAFRRGDLSSGQVGRILGLQSRWEAMSFLSEWGVYPGSDAEDPQQDMLTLARRREHPKEGVSP